MHDRGDVIQADGLIGEGLQREIAGFVRQIAIGRHVGDEVGPVGALVLVEQAHGMPHLVQPRGYRARAAAGQGLRAGSRHADDGITLATPARHLDVDVVGLVRLHHELDQSGKRRIEIADRGVQVGAAAGDFVGDRVHAVHLRPELRDVAVGKAIGLDDGAGDRCRAGGHGRGGRQHDIPLHHALPVQHLKDDGLVLVRAVTHRQRGHGGAGAIDGEVQCRGVISCIHCGNRDAVGTVVQRDAGHRPVDGLPRPSTEASRTALAVIVHPANAAHIGHIGGAGEGDGILRRLRLQRRRAGERQRGAHR